jgi:hypothetical protein
MGFVAGLIEEITMKWLIAIACLFIVAPALAAVRIVMDDKGNYIRLTDEACVSTKGQLSTIPDNVRPKLKAASIYFSGRLYEACYREFPNHVIVFDEDGEGAQIELRIFKPEVNA